MSFVHEALRRLFGALLDPVCRLPPLVALALVSAVSGLVLLFAFRFTSRPAAIRAAKRRIQANLLAVRIYQDDLRVVLQAQARTFAALGAYMGNMLVPFLVILAPFAIFFAHLDARFASRALHPGERTILTASVADVADLSRLTLEAANAGIAVDSRPVRVPSRREASWRIRAVEPGAHRILLHAGQKEIEKEVRVADGEVGAPALRARAGLESLLFAAAEPPIPAATGVESVAIAYPALDLSVFGFGLHWIVLFLVVSAAVAFALRKRAGVEF